MYTTILLCLPRPYIQIINDMFGQVNYLSIVDFKITLHTFYYLANTIPHILGYLLFPNERQSPLFNRVNTITPITAAATKPWMKHFRRSFFFLSYTMSTSAPPKYAWFVLSSSSPAPSIASTPLSSIYGAWWLPILLPSLPWPPSLSLFLSSDFSS